MNFRFTVLETSLNRAEFQWKARRLVRRLSILGLILCAALVLLGLAIINGWITGRPAAASLIALIAGGGIMAFVFVLLITSAGVPDRQWLASAVERTDRRFLDRLHALLSLEKRRGDLAAHAFAFRIARQAQEVVGKEPAKSPFPSAGSLAWFASFVAVLVSVLFLNRVYAPWRHLVSADRARLATAAQPQKPLDLSLPPTNSVEQPKRWGEVRITQPGADLQVTKLDVVPLQIEAAANEDLSQVQWLSAINGGNETAHELPPPAEPKYAIYQPTLYLDEFKLSDWDVMTYYAQAWAGSSNRYVSQVYFLEVRPFREDILKMPGGEGGRPYQALSELTGLIHRQEHVIRETYQHRQTQPQADKLEEQDRKKLAAAETDLGKSARHLYAKMATEMEHQPIGDALDNLAQAQNSLEGASAHLLERAIPQAQNDERGALASLLAARKVFHQAVTENPGAFDESQHPEQESPPVADSSDKLNRMAEFRNEAKAAQEFAKKALEQQRDIESRAHSAPLSQYGRLSEEEQQLSRKLQDFQEQHPEPLKGSEKQAAQSRSALNSAAGSLEKRSAEALRSTQNATQALRNFAQSLERQTLDQQLGDTYKLKRMLDQEAQALAGRAQPDSKMPDSQLRTTVRDTMKTLDQLKDAAEQEPTRSAFGQPLRDALSGPKKEQLDADLKQLQSASVEADKRASAGRAAAGLQNLSQAFADSQPKSLQMARQSDALKPGDNDSFAQGMAELDSLAKQLDQNRPIDKEEQSKQGQQALSDLERGMRSQFGDTERGQQLLAQLKGALKAEQGLEPGDLKRLIAALERFSAEASRKLAREDDQPGLANIDPAKLPPAYRGKIQKYFEKLSENNH